MVQVVTSKEQDPLKFKFFLKDLAFAMNTPAAPESVRRYVDVFIARAEEIEDTLEPKTTVRQFRTTPTAATPVAVERARKDLVEFSQMLIRARQ